LDEFDALEELAGEPMDCAEPEVVVPVEAEPDIPVVPEAVVPELRPVLAVVSEALAPEPVVELLVLRVLLQFTSTMARGKTKKAFFITWSFFIIRL
jgi:hypothetical protein